MGKGAEFERQTAKDLSRWLNGGDEEPVQLWRSVQSGGWKARSAPNVGDLQPVDDKGKEFRGHFAVECKHRQEIVFWRLFSQNDPNLKVWWDDITAEASQHGLTPLLIIKQNFYPTLIGYPPGLLPMGTAQRALAMPLEGCHFIQFETFLGLDPERVYQEHREWRGEE